MRLAGNQLSVSNCINEFGSRAKGRLRLKIYDTKSSDRCTLSVRHDLVPWEQNTVVVMHLQAENQDQ